MVVLCSSNPLTDKNGISFISLSALDFDFKAAIGVYLYLTLLKRLSSGIRSWDNVCLEDNIGLGARWHGYAKRCNHQHHCHGYCN